MIDCDGSNLLVRASAGQERHAFSSEEEAASRAAFILEAMTWIGTPFCDCGDVKGPQGAVDCAMMLTRCAVDTGLVPAFDPRPYAPRWHVHRDEELFIHWLETRLGAVETTSPRPGDVGVWQFGRTFSHGGVLVSTGEIVHAYAANRMVVRTRIDEPFLSQMPVLGTTKPRPVRWFDLWSIRA